MKQAFFLFIFLFALSPMTSIANEAVEIDGIYYNLELNNKEAEVTKNPNSYTGNFIIPDSIIFEGVKYSVTAIGKDACNGNTTLVSVTIPQSVHVIKSQAFYGCSNLSFVLIPNSVRTIESDAFANCVDLTSFSIPSNVTSINNNTFYNCKNLTSIIIPNNIVSIGDGAFQNCIGLTAVTISNSVTSIGNAAFRNCSNLTSITIPNSVKKLGDHAFRTCRNLTIVDMPNDITSLGESVFEGCRNLSSIDIPQGVTSIGRNAFKNCSSLSSIDIPERINEIGFSAFDGCDGIKVVRIVNLEAWCQIIFANPMANPLYYAHRLLLDSKEISNLVIPNSLLSIGDYSFLGCSSITSVMVSDNVMIIGESAFEGCNNLSSINLSDNLQIIRKQSFQGCSSLKKLTIPASVEYIYQLAFGGCSSLEEINSLATTPPFIYNDTFTNYSVPLNVPSGCQSVYYAADNWKNFTVMSEDNIYYRMIVSVSKNGTVSYNNNNVGSSSANVFNVKEGTDAQLTLTPHEGYRLASAKVNGVDKTVDVVDGVLTISNVTADLTVSVSFITAGETAAVTIGEAGMATYCAAKDLDFSEVDGLTAYTGAGFNRETGVLTMLKVTDAPAGTGLIVKGSEGTYEIPVKTSASVYANLLVGVTEETTLSQTAGGYVNYILANGSHGLGFYIVEDEGTLAAGKAYLRLPAAVAGESRTIGITFADDATGIEGISGDSKTTTDEWRDLQGRRIMQPTKAGIYLKDGRKIVVR